MQSAALATQDVDLVLDEKTILTQFYAEHARRKPELTSSPSRRSVSSSSSRKSILTKLVETHAEKAEWELSSSEMFSGDFEHAMKYLRKEIVGRDRVMEGPFGPRLKVYADYTASGQGLQFFNRYMTWLRENFANTHTEDSATGRFMTESFHIAIDSIGRCVNAGDEFVVICTGTGSTGGMLRLQQILGIYIPPASWSKLAALAEGSCAQKGVRQELVSLKVVPTNASLVVGASPEWLQAKEKVKGVLRDLEKLPLVFIGGYEHHSNELSWREGLCDVVRVPLTKSFEVDLEALDKLLQEYRAASPLRPIIGSFSACSNVTGMRTDLRAVSRLLRRVRASFFVDWAASAPYELIDCQEDLFDGFVASPHKFLGGDGSCGLLVLRKSVYDLKLPPTFAGGGTVKYVGKDHHCYSDDIIERENAGTPGSLQIFQCALAFELKEALGPKCIEEKEKVLLADFFAWLKETHPREVLVYGNPNPSLRHAIVSFNVVAPWPLQPRFVTVLLSDLFGVQTRAGCSCAGPHGHDLYKMSPEAEKIAIGLIVGDAQGRNNEIEDVGIFALKAGWCRLNLHYTMDDDEIWYLKQVISFVVQHGASFLSVYSFDAVSGTWQFEPPDTYGKPIRRSIVDGTWEHHFGLATALDGGVSRNMTDPSCRRKTFEAQLKSARSLLDQLPKNVSLGAPPAPFPPSPFPDGSGPSIVVADGQVRNLEELEKRVALHSKLMGTSLVPAAVITNGAVKPNDGKKETFSSQQMVPHVTLKWTDISYSIAQGKNKPRKEILSSCSGVVEPGQMLCILGPSGAGKTTLLDALSDRLRSSRNRELSGRVLVNGKPRDRSFRFIASYVPQGHSLYWMFTARQTLWHAADFLMPWSTTQSQKRDRIEEVLEMLGLKDCADTIVGMPSVIRGLSGGQLKRLSIGVELLGNPSVLILDEPTSSLDARAAAEVMKYLSSIAVRERRTVIATIHQPSTEIWNNFDRVCFLTGGRIAFFGARDEAVPFFASVGHTCPNYSNPADFMLQVLNTDFKGASTNTDAICNSFASSKPIDAVEWDKEPIRRGYANNGLQQFVILLRHLFLKNLKDPGILWVRVIMYTALSVLVAALFWDLGDKTSLAAVQSRLALNFYVAAFFVFMAIVAAPQLIEDRRVFIRERSNGYYNVLPYCLANYFTILPGLALITLVTGAIIIPSTGLMDFKDYFFMMFPALAVAEGIVNVFSALSPHYIVSSAGIAMLNGGFMLVEGFMQVKTDIPDYFLWMHHMAYHTYVFRLAMVATFKPSSVLDAGTWSKGLDVLITYEMDDVDKVRDYAVLAGYAVVLQVLFFCIMWWLHDGKH